MSLPGFTALHPGYGKKTSESRTPTEAGSNSAGPLQARPPLKREAHIYRRSTAVLVPRSLSSQGLPMKEINRLAGILATAATAIGDKALPPNETVFATCRAARRGRSKESRISGLLGAKLYDPAREGQSCAIPPSYLSKVIFSYAVIGIPVAH
jgi:hypothetical protein